MKTLVEQYKAPFYKNAAMVANHYVVDGIDEVEFIYFMEAAEWAESEKIYGAVSDICFLGWVNENYTAITDEPREGAEVAIEPDPFGNNKDSIAATELNIKEWILAGAEGAW